MGKAALRRNKDGRAYVRVSGKVAGLIAGDDTLTSWDDEELLRGQAKSKRGKFEGRPPTMVPREVYAEWARRQMEQGFQDMLGDLREVVKAVRYIATDQSQDASVRLRAAEMVLDRIYGKPKQAVDIGVAEREKYQQVLDDVTIQRDLAADTDDSEIIDAEIVEDEDEFAFDDDDEWEDATREQAWNGKD